MWLKQDSVVLRDFCETDIENKIRWINDPENNAYLHYDIPLEYQKTLQWYNNKNNEKRLDCVIEYNDVPVGLIGLVEIDYINMKAEFYVCLGEKHHKGNGIAKIASKMLLTYAFDELQLRKIYLNVDAENTVACHLYENVGFICEGYFKNDMLHRGRYIDRKRYSIFSDNKEKINNVLILSAGTRNKIVQYFKKALAGEGNVIAADMSELAPAVYEADRFYKVPRITDPEYIDVVFDICKKEHIRGLLSLIDPELSLLAEHKEEFAALGVTIIGSSYELCERSLNKMEMYQWLSSHGYSCAKSYSDKEAFYADVQAGIISYPVFVKPICGSASLDITKAHNKETVDVLFANNDNIMIQEFLDGQEIGVDVYIDMISGEVVSIFAKKKVVMRAGETDKSISFKNEKLFSMIERFVKESGFLGQIDIDVFEIDGRYYISEVNPRFGGGYPHAYECGCDHMTMILNNLKGKSNEKKLGQYDEGVCMMKYSEIAIRRISD